MEALSSTWNLLPSGLLLVTDVSCMNAPSSGLGLYSIYVTRDFEICYACKKHSTRWSNGAMEWWGKYGEDSIAGCVPRLPNTHKHTNTSRLPFHPYSKPVQNPSRVPGKHRVERLRHSDHSCLLSDHPFREPDHERRAAFKAGYICTPKNILIAILLLGDWIILTIASWSCHHSSYVPGKVPRYLARSLVWVFNGESS